MTGYFITLEGGEGAGKSTVIQSLEHQLTKKGYRVLTTREPGGIEIAEKIREIILDPAHTMMDSYTEALLYAAARRQHLVEKVIPALKKDWIVLCDRFIDSSLAYQGYARKLGISDVLAINEFALQNCMPHLTLLLNIAPEKGLKRIATNKLREQNRLDIETLSFHQRVHEGYLQLVQKYPERIQIINAEQQLEKVLADSLTTILSFLEKKKQGG